RITKLKTDKLAATCLLALSSFVLVLGPFLLFAWATKITFTESDQNLAADWEQCVLETSRIEAAKELSSTCAWEKSDYYSIKRPKNNDPFIRILRKNLKTSAYCEQKNCSLLVGRLGDASEFYLNEKFIGRFIDFPPNLISTFAYSTIISIPN